jgi:hypothetical protein
MKKQYQEKVVGYLANEDYYCAECYHEYQEENKMTARISIDEAIWGHDFGQDDRDEIEDPSQVLYCTRCRRSFAPENPKIAEEAETPGSEEFAL